MTANINSAIEYPSFGWDLLVRDEIKATSLAER